MKLRTVILIGVLSAGTCLADEPPAFAGEFAALDYVFAKAQPQAPTAHAALQLLEQVALGRMSSAPPLEALVGLPLGALHRDIYRSGPVRRYALRKIAAVDLPEALLFLEDLTQEALDPDSSGQVWPSVAIAIHEGRLRRITEPTAQIIFLEETLQERNSAADWAADELCDRGSVSSLPLIRELIHKSYSVPVDADQIGFCERRISALSRSPDRITALGSLLSAKEGSTDRRLLTWAIDQLFSMNSDRADGELRRYAAEIDSAVAAMADTPSKWLLARTRNDINTLLAKRTK